MTARRQPLRGPGFPGVSRRPGGGAGAALALASVALAAAAALSPGCGGGAVASGEKTWVPVVRDDLVIEVDVTGQLRATRTRPVGPPIVKDMWDFKIVSMASEGIQVKKGDHLMTFDAGEIEQDIADTSADRDRAAQEIVKKKIDLELSRREGEMKVREAEAMVNKARLKADLPAEYTAAVEMKLARLELEAAETELRMARQRLSYQLKLGEAEVGFLRDKHAEEDLDVKSLEAALDRMNVKAPVDGLLVYRANWRGEKKKVGDSCWVGEGCVEIVDLTEMMGKGEVEETESALVASGQRAILRLEAAPEAEWTARVLSAGTNVFRQSPRTPLKVVSIDLKLDRTDARTMRPGMFFRGRIETARVPRAVLVPLEAVFVRPAGPIAFRKTAIGHEVVKLALGKRNQRQVEVQGGLAEGDQVSRLDLEAPGSGGPR